MAQHLVPHVMAEAIIDAFEIIDIAEDQGYLIGGSFGSGNLFHEPGLEVPLVEQAGQMVGQAELSVLLHLFDKSLYLLAAGHRGQFLQVFDFLACFVERGFQLVLVVMDQIPHRNDAHELFVFKDRDVTHIVGFHLHIYGIVVILRLGTDG